MASRFILAISTSSGVAKVVATTEPHGSDSLGAGLFGFEIVDYKSQSAQLLPMIRQHLEQSGAKPAQCAAIAVDIGPGGFTSLRTACGIAQGLAVAWQVPAVPLTSFECMLPEQYSDQSFTLLIDARLNEIYAARIRRTSKGTEWLDPPHLLAMDEFQNIQGPAVCDAHLYAQRANPGKGIEPGVVCATRLAQLAWQEFAAGRVVAPFDCQPLYVRDKVAQTTTERLALKHGVI
ncbi:tRNA (adenosine(37)-N6)-threonylcarbamoyltransferase complex dimerization subunit type 1 TsaB [Limnobacter sp. CACIAM 66H1]|jgi:tRNA threonylcarbamoyladenosine biosynthesis protein TsaB|uniref:tRNA (adenosine(37)-N6)-threonylcarbamoyltransferase complex dimerization subunit type 1 TsaB n=1 Tax=Limnobacter sp. CACIAM 66H1 TaxID=1813033 RepID=UPI0025BDA847|nr:tRNA (adenosine(37)-N6)-threonylcarbamoyltransferase complex dimerization subunit type 1 TsaB [Limnobacter sp. CACIAM 66H1]